MEEEFGEKSHSLESTNLNRYSVRFYLHNAFPNFTTVQILESRLCDAETMTGGIDGGNRNGRVVRYVG